MVRWKCTQCDESLEAPDDFAEVIECPKCGHYSRPTQAPAPKLPHPDLVKAEQHFMANRKAKESSDEKRFTLYAKGSSRAQRTGDLLCLCAFLVLLYTMAMDTTNGNVHNLGLMNDRLVLAIIGSALFVVGGFSIALGVISKGIIRLLLDLDKKSS